MPPVTVATVPIDCPQGGVYLFYDNDRPMYAGRTKRKINARLKGHVNTANDCPFAWHLARDATGFKKASYSSKNSRKELLAMPEFRRAYEAAKVQIKGMKVKYVGESDPIKQAMLEIYVAMVSGAKYNDFDTH